MSMTGCPWWPWEYMLNELMAGDWLIGGERDGEGVSGLNFSLPVGELVPFLKRWRW